MSDAPPPADPVPVDPDKAARQRHFAIGLFRLSGALIVAFGFLVLMERFAWVQGGKAKALGVILVLVGLFQYIIVPRLLSALFRTPPPQ